MTYEKPKVVATVSAASAVQSTQKNGVPGDNLTRTAPAYEADE